MIKRDLTCIWVETHLCARGQLLFSRKSFETHPECTITIYTNHQIQWITSEHQTMKTNKGLQVHVVSLQCVCVKDRFEMNQEQKVDTMDASICSSGTLLRYNPAFIAAG